jgi:hypothetical protein
MIIEDIEDKGCWPQKLLELERRIAAIEEALDVKPKEEIKMAFLRRQRQRRETMREGSWGKEEI